MSTILDIISGVGWSLVYIVAIIQGIRNKTWCLPQLAICQNFAWEFWIVFYRLNTGQHFSILYAVQLAWLLLDIGVLATWLMFDRSGGKPWRRKAALLAAVMSVMYVLTICFDAWEVSAYLINTIMSVAFVWRVRKSAAAWTSLPIAIFKLVGTLAPTILYGILMRDPILLWLGGLCLIFDVYYLAILIDKNERKGSTL